MTPYCLIVLSSLAAHALAQSPLDEAAERARAQAEAAGFELPLRAPAPVAAPAAAEALILASIKDSSAEVRRAAANGGDPKIQIVSAVYGSQRSVNATNHVARACDGKESCDYSRDLSEARGEGREERPLEPVHLSV